MRDTLSAARSDIYDYVITPLETYRTRFLPVTMDAFLAIEVCEPIDHESFNQLSNFTRTTVLRGGTRWSSTGMSYQRQNK